MKRRGTPPPRRFQYVLYAQAADKTRLQYVGGLKFSRKGHPVRFATRSHALTIATQLRRQFPILKKYQLRVAP